MLQRPIVRRQSIDEGGIAPIEISDDDLLPVPCEHAVSRRDRRISERDVVAAIAPDARFGLIEWKHSTAQRTTDRNQTR